MHSPRAMDRFVFSDFQVLTCNHCGSSCDVSQGRMQGFLDTHRACTKKTVNTDRVERMFCALIASGRPATPLTLMEARAAAVIFESSPPDTALSSEEFERLSKTVETRFLAEIELAEIEKAIDVLPRS